MEFFLKRCLFLIFILIIWIGILVSALNYKFSFPLVVYKVTSRDLNEVYINLMNHTGAADRFIVPLIIDPSKAINAYTYSDKIVVTQGFIDYAKSKDEVAVFLSHEIGHVMLGHIGGVFKEEISILEGNADKIGMYLMLRSGYNICAAKGLWERIRHDFGDYEYNANHPNHSYRVWELSFDQCMGN